MMIIIIIIIIIINSYIKGAAQNEVFKTGFSGKHLDPRGMRMGSGKDSSVSSLYRSPNVIRVIKSRRLKWASQVVRIRKGWSSFKILTGKHTGKRPLGRPRYRWD